MQLKFNCETTFLVIIIMILRCISNRLLLILLVSINCYIHAADITFCDGPTQKVSKSREQCSSGFNFGNKKPECVCIKGIYRLWTDKCETADGFAEEVCTKLHDSSTGANIVGLKLSKDPVDWSQTGVVCEKRTYGSDSWDLITANTRGASTNNNNIYALNGKAFWETKGSRGSICVQPVSLPENERICKYLRKDNAAVWKQNEISIEVKKGCKGIPLRQSSCFGVLKKKDSECELSCQRAGRGMQRQRGRALQRAENNEDPSSAGPEVAVPAGPKLTTSQILNDNLTNPADYRRHDNKFLNRKMLIYNIISQIEESPLMNGTNATPYGEPKKTFELFHMMKNITQSFCPAEYVNPDWIELVANLFYILHKGNVFRYEELLNDEEYEWIKSILTTCMANVETIELASKILMNDTDTSGEKPTPPPDTCAAKATGWCVKSGDKLNGTIIEGCNFRPVTVAPHRANSSYHYVPDVAWDIVDLIQVACFDSFNASYRMFHVLEQASEKLFSLQIKNLWYDPGWSPKTKKKLLGAAADLQMSNFEVCIESAYDKNGKIPRLVRPTLPKYLRKKRAVRADTTIPSIGKHTQVYCSRSKKEFHFPRNCRAVS